MNMTHSVTDYSVVYSFLIYCHQRETSLLGRITITIKSVDYPPVDSFQSILQLIQRYKSLSDKKIRDGALYALYYLYYRSFMTFKTLLDRTQKSAVYKRRNLLDVVAFCVGCVRDRRAQPVWV